MKVFLQHFKVPLKTNNANFIEITFFFVNIKTKITTHFNIMKILKINTWTKVM